ncbi:cyclin-dependent kinase F-1 [Vigna unguiculata]|uniref:cyclin-dependent kinase n=1 Tax=Vigna unguiculata TaxID=3917 RepID=A0A4D6LUN9_VIGUN|nr:cyclin-dependent kinase F-1 [Vigna unguiculata]QCD92078.1 cell cycle related kinase [Vigna unguiculata]
MDPPAKSWSIHTRSEITAKYEVVGRVGSGAYADVYDGRRRSDGAAVALKEVHDSQSASREIEALRVLRGSQNVVVLHEFFWREDEDAVLVLEFLGTDLATVIGKGGVGAGEVKRWMLQALSAVDECHRNMIVHRDLKPANFLVSDDGVLKLADFGQARILVESGFDADQEDDDASNRESSLQQDPEATSQENLNQTEHGNPYQRTLSHEEYFRVLDEMKTKSYSYDTDKEANIHDGNTSCLATCTTSDIDDELCKGSFTYEAEEVGGNELGCLTSCVGTRWFRAPELLYGSTDYGLEVDLWSLGCVFAELLTSKPLFPGTSDVDQLSRIVSVLGNINEETWPGCSKLPDYGKISFLKVENPSGLEACLLNCTPDEVSLVKRLVCYDPDKRVTAMELLEDKYFSEVPVPGPVSELRVPLISIGQDKDRPGGYNEMGSDSDLEEFRTLNITTTDSDLSVQIP